MRGSISRRSRRGGGHFDIVPNPFVAPGLGLGTGLWRGGAFFIVCSRNGWGKVLQQRWLARQLNTPYGAVIMGRSRNDEVILCVFQQRGNYLHRGPGANLHDNALAHIGGSVNGGASALVQLSQNVTQRCVLGRDREHPIFIGHVERCDRGRSGHGSNWLWLCLSHMGSAWMVGRDSQRRLSHRRRTGAAQENEHRERSASEFHTDCYCSGEKGRNPCVAAGFRPSGINRDQ